MREIKNIENIFENKGFNIEDRYDFYRFWSKVEIKDRVDDCWNWTRHILPNGYGRLGWNDTAISAHRMAYILSKGAIPDRLQVQHLCNNKKCCNPYHHSNSFTKF